VSYEIDSSILTAGCDRSRCGRSLSFKVPELDPYLSMPFEIRIFLCGWTLQNSLSICAINLLSSRSLISYEAIRICWCAWLLRRHSVGCVSHQRLWQTASSRPCIPPELHSCADTLADAIAELGIRDKMPELLTVLRRERNIWVRSWILAALAIIEDHNSVDRLFKMLE
jgi:hypothetical protein